MPHLPRSKLFYVAFVNKNYEEMLTMPIATLETARAHREYLKGRYSNVRILKDITEEDNLSNVPDTDGTTLEL